MKLLQEKTIKKITGEDLFTRIDKEIKAVGKINILFINVTSAAELFSAFSLVLGFLLILLLLLLILNPALLKPFLVLMIGLPFIMYLSYRDTINKYKKRLMADNELPAILETFVSGLSVGMPVENIMRYIVENKKGYMKEIIQEALQKADAGIPLSISLEEAADKSLNKYFQRAVKILIKTSETSQGLAEQLNELLRDIEEERINEKTAKASVLDNVIAIPVLIGFFIPLLVFVIFPFIVSFSNIFGTH
ncbi:tight adherence protein C [Thermoanaerobacter thermohydrosulfuricus]|uniref:Tight adherence protein C n=1 Tax=Thermoanaerobacter thermohydrosulfuricus TaxID=1516 RepID=A0A1G7HPA3_THETY|nr:type II secretion system F family protein [Thermoanaerobacter thermohydrosulfuricus]SDF02285.1 tight adherence protein C [Thermoanaerobacter thermohydrosulfuricus]